MSIKPLISVIVPVYKVKEYLNRCVKSIIEQTYKNLEIILVDDGSPDCCGDMCEEWAQKDSRIKVLHKENGGLSDARNYALDVMRGEFVTFIDSDDFVSKYYVENLHNALCAGDAELSISWFENVFEDEKIQSCATNVIDDSLQIYCVEQCLEKMLYQDGVETSAWGKLYKRELFDKLRYPIGKLYEDVPITYKTIMKCNAIAVISNVDYYYFQRGQSIQNETFTIKKLDGVVHMEELMNTVSKYYPELRSAAICRYFSTTCNILFQITGKGNEKVRLHLWNEVKKYRNNVLMNRRGRKKARIAALLSYGGYGMLKEVYQKTQWRGKSSSKDIENK